MRTSKPGRVLLAAACLLSGFAARGQSTYQPGRGSLDIAVLYNPLLTNVVSANRFTMQGGTVQVHGQFFRGLGAVADVAVLHTGSTSSGGPGLDLVAATFGARYTWRLARGRTALSGQAGLGQAFGLNSVFPGPGSASSAANSIAYQVGGGLSVGAGPHFSLRVFDADWLRTQLPNSTTDVQNSLRIGAGVVLRFR